MVTGASSKQKQGVHGKYVRFFVLRTIIKVRLIKNENTLARSC